MFGKIDGIMDKKVYHNILVRHAVPSGLRLIGNNLVFQEDNDPKHSSNYYRNYLRKEAAGVLTIMTWPGLLDKSRVKTKKALWLELKRCWESISITLALCRNVVKSKGGHTTKLLKY